MASPRCHRRATVPLHHAAALLLALSCGFAGVVDARADPTSPDPKVPAVIVFGDSTVDTGNNNVIGTILKSDFPPYGRDMAGGAHATGRFCNGRLPPDFISEALGLPPLVPAYLDPAYGIQDFAQGVCFASAGTGLDNKTAGVLLVKIGHGVEATKRQFICMVKPGEIGEFEQWLSEDGFESRIGRETGLVVWD